MTFLEHVLLVLHFVGLAALLGAFLGQMSAATKTAPIGMLHGALTQLVTGLALVPVVRHDDGSINNAKFGVKLVVLLVITALVIRGRRRQSISKGEYFGIGGLTLANIVIAVFW